MKARESGMPPAEMWQTFFNPTSTLLLFGLEGDARHVVDFGCGYGTFTIPAAQLVTGIVHAFDIDPEMIAETRRKAEQAGLPNVRLYRRDFIAEGTGLAAAAVDYIMMFNILHAEQPLQLLREAYRIMRSGARIAIMHWNYDPQTPRGPSMAIRPRPEDCRNWVREAGFEITTDQVDVPPYHYGIIARKR